MKSVCLLLALLVLAPSTRAGGLDAKRVAADARWVAHFDMEALLRSKLYTELKEAEPSIDAHIDVEEMKAEFGIDPLHDLRSLTVYCAGTKSEDTVAILVGNEKLDQAEARLGALDGHRTLDVGGHLVHQFGEHDETWYAYVSTPAGGSDRVVVLAKGQKLLEQGLAVLDGRAANLATADGASIRAKPQAGSIVFAACSQSLAELGEIGSEQASAIARLAQSCVLDVGEDRGELFANLAITTEKPEDALRVQQVLQGATALLSLVGGDEGASARIQHLVAALRFESLGSMMNARFRYPVRDLIEDLQALDDESPRPHHHQGHRGK
jgi:hypothetical protein